MDSTEVTNVEFSGKFVDATGYVTHRRTPVPKKLEDIMAQLLQALRLPPKENSRRRLHRLPAHRDFSVSNMQDISQWWEHGRQGCRLASPRGPRHQHRRQG